MSALTKRFDTRRRIIPTDERRMLERTKEGLQNDDKGMAPEISRDMKKHIIAGAGLKDFGVGGTGSNDARIARIKKILEAGTPDTLSPADKTVLEKEKAQLVERVKKVMVPKSQTQLLPGKDGSSNPDFRRAVNAMVKGEHSPSYLQDAHLLKNICKQLDPDDPDAGNLEKFRPD